jgi:hypothetical protein
MTHTPSDVFVGWMLFGLLVSLFGMLVTTVAYSIWWHSALQTFGEALWLGGVAGGFVLGIVGAIYRGYEVNQ